MTAPGGFRTGQGPTRAPGHPSVVRRRPHRHRTRSRRPLLPALAAVVVGLALGAAAARGVAGSTQAVALVDGVLGSSSSPAVQATPAAELLDRDGSQSRMSDGRAPGLTGPVEAPLGMLPTDPPPTVFALPPGLTAQDVAAGLLSADVPESAAGTFTVVAGTDPGPGTGTVRTVRVEVEDGLAIDPVAFAATVMATLNDPRGWGGDGSLSFARTDGDAEIRVLLASPSTVDDLCAPLRTDGEVSCGRAGHAALNLRRWVEATPEYAPDKALYRQYLVNHEVGHLLGHAHERCPGAGQVAPVMQQQSYRVAPCTPNAWPFP